MTDSRAGAPGGALARRAGIGTLIALGSTLAGRARESWETGGPGISALEWSDGALAVLAGLLAGAAFHFVRGHGTATVKRHYLAWVTAAAAAAVPILLPDARLHGPWVVILGAPAFGVLAGGGWAIFLRRIEGHDL